MQPQAMRDPVNCAAPFFYCVVEGGVDVVLDENREGTEEGTGSGSVFVKVLEPILQVEVSDSPLHLTCSRTLRQRANKIWFSMCLGFVNTSASLVLAPNL